MPMALGTLHLYMEGWPNLLLRSMIWALLPVLAS